VKKVWKFALTGKQATLIAVCLALAGLLSSLSGFAVGLLVASNRRGVLAVARPELPKPAFKTPGVPALQLQKPESTAKSQGKDRVVPPPVVSVAPPAETGKGAVSSTEAPAAVKPVSLPIRIAVQVGSFSTEEAAGDALERLHRFGYPATSFPMTDGHNREWHVVQVGPYAKYEEASRVAMELSARYRIEPRIVPLTNF
jgi:cell division septation protein DedD